MNLKQYYLKNNACYQEGKRHAIRGIMVHSTGANNPFLNRYVGPDDGLLGKNQYNNHWNTYKPSGIFVCVHAFVGKLQDGTVATYQTLPWDFVGWHSGTGHLGANKNANNTGYIGFEICEDDLTDKTYFDKVYQESVELCAFLCKEYNLSSSDIICHSEGAQKGIASNHADVMHWFPRHGKNMNMFRADVRRVVDAKRPIEKQVYRVQTGAFSSKDNAIKLANELKAKGFAAYVVPNANIFRVQVGAFSMQDNADEMLRKITTAGYKAFIVSSSANSQTGKFEGINGAIKEGSKIKITGTHYVVGYPVPQWVKQQTYTVEKVENDKALIKEITSWVWLKDLVLAED